MDKQITIKYVLWYLYIILFSDTMYICTKFIIFKRLEIRKKSLKYHKEIMTK